MKNRKSFFNKYYVLYFLLLAFLVFNTILFAYVNMGLLIVSAALSFAACVFVVYRIINLQKYSKKLSLAFDKEARSGSKLLSGFNTPVIYTSHSGEVLWYNEKFANLLQGNERYGVNIYEMLGLPRVNDNKSTHDICFANFEFTVYSSFSDTTPSYGIFYMFDNTKLKHIAKEYYESRPVMMMITYDNFNEVLGNVRESERNSFKSSIHKEIETWLSEVPCISINRGDSNAFIILEERHLSKLIAEKFSILDSVRKLRLNDVGGITLSIGVGRGGKTISECESYCKQALDMAQSRGGDQVAIKSSGSDYKFFGGVSKALERKTKVRARVVSSALYEMFGSAYNIIFMGHKFSDLDCLGAAFGLSTLSAHLNKQSYIILNSEKTLALSLYKKITESEQKCIFTSGDDIDDVITDKTLLVIVDTHRPCMLENIEVYNKCKNVVVIDHHRKAVDAIDNAVIFYHETATSSTCEMVSEILQYIDGYNLPKIASEALLSGIILDSKNLCLHTGVRTFEACAYLRSRGADPIAVKRLFSETKLTYSRKADIVSAVKLYNDCAISIDEKDDSVTRIASSQAADELLNLEGVNASFVMSKNGEEINISARSLGEINVQLIMESLGGGGHQTMAACQLGTIDFNYAYKALIEAINDYKKKL